MLILIIMLIIPVSGKTEVYITLDKDIVAPEDLIRIRVTVLSDLPNFLEILVKGSGGVGQWLYENDSVQIFDESFDFQIPEDWEDGVYLVKVNLIENSTTKEFFKQFKVVKPKITKIDIPEVPYQGKTLVNVYVDTPDESVTSLSFKFIGLNFRFTSKEEFKPYKNLAKLELNLRERYEETKDIDYALKPGIYAMEITLNYKGKIFDSRVLTVEVAKPRLSVQVPEEIMAGDPIRIGISTNRVGEGYGGTYYKGIVLTLVGENYKTVRVVELNEKGEANIMIETAGLSEGEYKLYIRDTMLTYRKYEPKSFAYLYYDLDPKDPAAKEFYAQDDILIVKYIRITKNTQIKSKSILFFEPTDQTADQGELVNYRILLSFADDGLSAYDLAIYLTNKSVAEIYRIYFPEWAYETYKVISKDHARFSAIDLKGFIGKGVSRVEIATITLKALSEGDTEITVKMKRMDADNGEPINPYVYSAYLIVNQTVNQTLELNETEQLNETEDAPSNSTEEISDTENHNYTDSHEEQNLSSNEQLNSIPGNLDNLNSSDQNSQIPKNRSLIKRPKELETDIADIVLMAGVSASFVLVLGRGKFH